MPRYIYLTALLAYAFSNPASALQRIAILNFELNDFTALPNTPEEQQRTASIAPLLQQAVSELGDYQIVDINTRAQTAANASFGYLFRFDDLAAKLAQQANADWVIVAQHSKPSFLFSYLIAHLINVKSQKQIASYDIEMKGNHAKVTQHSVNALAKKIAWTISQQQD
ncbi:MAG: DUF2380 domain-containing protein [Methylococcaceae bacterium]|jgi:hypothetical protein